MGFMEKIFGDLNEKEVKRISKIVDKVEALDEQMQALSNEELRGKTDEFRQRIADGETLDDLLPEAFAVCREGAWRSLGMKHFRVQLIGGVVLHQGRIAEMKTGEGKTLVATLPAYLNALEGKGVHVVTVNDYLAKRDAEWMGKLYNFLGLKVGCVIHAVEGPARHEQYMADITYGTNNEFGFDYLRDNMVTYKEQLTQRELNYAIVDEVDSILIDEARTPLIISGRGVDSSDMYKKANSFSKTLIEEQDYNVDEKDNQVSLTEDGVSACEKYFGIDNFSDPDNMELNHYVMQALRANYLMKRDVDYIVKDGEILIVDEFTGRIMYGRRFSNGLHQAIEAKEGVKVRAESKTLATITLQNYFRMYGKLAGMTGTAKTEEDEFRDIYNMDVVVIPTNKPITRIDNDDAIYAHQSGKYKAIVEKVVEAHEAGQPVLVGTISIEISELLSKMLTKRGIKHNVLNAKHHEREAEIVADAGREGAVTIATNMAGRGTDIILGGNSEYMAKAEMRKMQIPEELISEATGFSETDDEAILEARKTFAELEKKYKEQMAGEADAVREAGGLFILGTVRHESRRIDNQLRGRAGRQGDPGESRFYLSAEDDIMRLFAGDKFYKTLDMFKIDETMPIEAGMFSKSVEMAQKRVESNNFAIRKNVLQYDDVMNKQREIIYSQRNQVLDGVDMDATIRKMIKESITDAVEFYCPASHNKNDWNIAGLEGKYMWLMGDEKLPDVGSTKELSEFMVNKAIGILDAKTEEYGKEIMVQLEHKVLIHNVDVNWMDHIDAMDQLKRSIGLRAYAQQDPVVAFRQEGYDMFDEMTMSIREGTVKMIITAVIRSEEDLKRKEAAKVTSTSGTSDGSTKKQPVRNKTAKVGRNDPCPCGSGKKYKHCCGR